MIVAGVVPSAEVEIAVVPLVVEAVASLVAVVEIAVVGSVVGVEWVVVALLVAAVVVDIDTAVVGCVRLGQYGLLIVDL